MSKILSSLVVRLKNNFFSIPMAFSVFVGTFLVFRPFFPLFFDGGLSGGEKLDYAYIVSIVHGTGVFNLFVPAIAVLPAACQFCNDYSSGYFRFVLARKSKRTYLFETMLGTGLIGGIAVAIPLILLLLFSVTCGAPYLSANVPHTEASVFYMTVFEDIQFIGGGLFVQAISITLAFLSGAIWSVVGLASSAFSPNKFVAVTFPLALYYGMGVLFYRFNLVQFSPLNTIMPTSSEYIELPLLFALQIGLVCIAFLLFYIRGYWRIRNA